MAVSIGMKKVRDPSGLSTKSRARQKPAALSFSAWTMTA